MMVPLADFMNHLPIDTNYDVYSKNSHEVKQSINGEKTQARKTGDKKTDYSQLYKKEFAEDSVDPHYTATIKGQLGKKKTKAPREEIIDDIKSNMEHNLKCLVLGTEDKIVHGDIWQQRGYCSTDCAEENDDEDPGKKKTAAEAAAEEDEYDEYYDEEEEDEESKADPTSAIEKEKEELKVPEEERELMR